MPGVGGGSRGGGFGRGGGIGGRGGGFGRGPFMGGFYRPFFPMPFFGYGYGGGCLSGFMGMTLLPILLFTIIASFSMNVFGSIGSSITNLANGGSYKTDDKVMAEYCEKQYAEEFDDAHEYEDNILLVFLVNDGYDDFYTMAYIGDNINDSINEMFGGRYSEYGQSLIRNLNPSYESSLSRNLAATVRDMLDEILALNLSSPFIENKGSPKDYLSHVKNESQLDVNNETLNSALQDFTEKTDIPIVIVIDDMEDVFEKSISPRDIVNILLVFLIVGIMVFYIVRIIKGRKSKKNDNDSNDYYAE